MLDARGDKMSIDFFIVCHKCRERLHVGQGRVVYTGEPETMEALRQFLYTHRDELHPLGFFGDYAAPAQDYKRFEPGPKGTDA